MEVEEVDVTTVDSGRSLDRPGFILSNSLPLQRSQTFESNGREGLDTKRVRRRSSNGILREGPRKGRLSLRAGGHEHRLPSFEALGIAARFSKYSPFTPKSNLSHQSNRSTRAPSPPPVSPTTPNVLPTTSRSDATPSTSHQLCPTHGFTFPLTPPDERTSLEFPSALGNHTDSHDLCQSHVTSTSAAMLDLQEQEQEQKTITTAPSDAPTQSGTDDHVTALNTISEMGASLPASSGDLSQTNSSFWLDEGIIASGEHPSPRPTISALI